MIDDLYQGPSRSVTKRDAGVLARSRRGAEEVVIIRDDHARLREAVRELLFVAMAQKSGVGRRRDVDPAPSQLVRDRVIHVLVEVKSDLAQAGPPPSPLLVGS